MGSRLFFTLFLLFLSASPGWAQGMTAHFIDVGQGDATLIEFPCGAILIDSGGEDNAQFHSTEVLEAYLDGFFAHRPHLGGRLDLFLITHPHIDHTRGVDRVLEKYAPRNVIVNGMRKGSGWPGQRSLLDHAEDRNGDADPSNDVGLKVVEFEDLGQVAVLTGEVVDPLDCGGQGDPVVTLLWGEIENRPSHWSTEDFNDGNNHSIVVRLDYGGASLLLTGDLEEVAIHDLLQAHADTNLLDVDVYQVGHHGSRNGTTPALVRAMSPEIAIISCGNPKRKLPWTAHAYGHPNEYALGQLQVGVSGSRIPIKAETGRVAERFDTLTIDQAIYATAWDGTVILAADQAGTWTVLSPGGMAPLDLNTATAAELAKVPRIGPVLAERIVQFRTENGPFVSLDDLLQVPGIGPLTLEAIRARLMVE